MGADYWSSPNGGGSLKGIGEGRFKYATNAWQSYNCSTLYGEELLKNPPPITATGGAPAPVQPAPTSGSVPLGKTITLFAQANQTYVSGWLSDDQAPLYARVTWRDQWEQFLVEDAGNGQIALKSVANGNYISVRNDAEGAPLRAEASAIGPWEKFTWIDAGSGKFGLKAGVNGLFVSARNDEAGEPLKASASILLEWEEFTWQAI